MGWKAADKHLRETNETAYAIYRLLTDCNYIGSVMIIAVVAFSAYLAFLYIPVDTSDIVTVRLFIMTISCGRGPTRRAPGAARSRW